MNSGVEDAQASFNPQITDLQTPTMSAYERSREERIKANLERMQKLGITDLSLKFKSLTSPPKRTRRNTPPSAKRDSPLAVLQTSEPRRRSSRLQNATPVSYSEAVMAKKSGTLEVEEVMLEEGSKPEVYTEEHEKLLGSTEKSWTLFVDGYGKDGKRIYDPVKGKTCHQCRQKTLGHRTRCSQCDMVQGQFCGDCLYMRYGEHVLEAIENPNWICPVCRGICNCSFCRHGKGWAPTGVLYKKITSLGYKSVAHYLIQTQRSQNTEEKNLATVNQTSAKRSLPFAEMEIPSKRSPEIKNEQIESSMPQNEDTIHDKLKSNDENQLPNSTTFANKENELEFEVKEDKKVHDYNNSEIRVERCTKLERKRALVFEPSPESIVAEWTDMNEKSYEIKQPLNNVLTDHEVEREKDTLLEDDIYANNSIADHEVKRENETLVEDDRCANNSIIAQENSPMLKKKTGCDTEQNPESIGGRLRQRRKMNKD